MENRKDVRGLHKCPVCGKFAKKEVIGRYRDLLSENLRLRVELLDKEVYIARLERRGFFARLFGRK